MADLTGRQKEVLNWIRAYVRKFGIAPTRTEIAQGLGLADSSSVKAHLKRLEEAGCIEVLLKKTRGIRLIDGQVPVIRPLAKVAAGTPIVCKAHIVQRGPASGIEQFRQRPDYLLIVRGDSMDRTGVDDQDVVAVVKTSEVKSGQVVVARFGDEVTLKRFVRINKRHVELRPESHNRAHKVMKLDLAKHILNIDGVVVGALIKELRDRPGARRQGGKAATPRKRKTRI